MGNGSFIPNSTQVHNVVLDVLLPFMREGERAVFLYIFRRTFGFNRHEDAIGLDQFEHGLMTPDGKRLDYGCGMKRRVINQALGFLMAAGIIERLEGGVGRTHISLYRMNVKECPLVQQLEEMQERNTTAKEIAQILHPFRKVADSALNTKKKSNKSKDSKSKTNSADSAPFINSADSAPFTAETAQILHPLSAESAPFSGCGLTHTSDSGGVKSVEIQKDRKETKNPPIAPQGGERDDRFETFWKAYPRKEAKGRARNVWKRLKPTASLLDRMLEAVSQQRASRSGKRITGQFIPHPATWLNDQRWEDEELETISDQWHKPISHDEVEL